MYIYSQVQRHLWVCDRFEVAPCVCLDASWSYLTLAELRLMRYCCTS